MYQQHCCVSSQVRWEANVRNGVCGLSFDRRDIAMNKFVVCCLEAQFHVFDARTQHPEQVCVCVEGGGMGRATQPQAMQMVCLGNC